MVTWLGKHSTFKGHGYINTFSRASHSGIVTTTQASRIICPFLRTPGKVDSFFTTSTLEWGIQTALD